MPAALPARGAWAGGGSRRPRRRARCGRRSRALAGSAGDRYGATAWVFTSIDSRNATTAAWSGRVGEHVRQRAVGGAVLDVADHAGERLAGAVVVVGRHGVDAEQRRHVEAVAPAVAVVVDARARPAAGCATPATSAAAAFSPPPMLSPIGLPRPATPRLNEPMFAQERGRGTGRRPGCRTDRRRAGAVCRGEDRVSAAGGGVKSLTADRPHAAAVAAGARRPGEQRAALRRSSPCETPPGTSAFGQRAVRACGSRTAPTRCSAVSAGTASCCRAGSTVSCWRFGVRLGEVVDDARRAG